MTLYDSLVLRALEIRNAILVGENTAERVGSLFRDILDYMKTYLEQVEKDWSDLDKKYLSKNDDDVAKGLIKFLQGVEFGKFAEGVSGGAVDGNGDAEFRNLKVRQKFGVKELTVGDYVEGVDGAHIDEHGNAELGELITRGLATLAQLRVKGDSEFDGNLSSRDFISGFLSGKGWAIYKTLNENAAGVEEEKWNAEFDNITVRGTLRVFEMIISQLLGENDNRVFTGMMEVDHYDAESGKVYLDTQGGKLYNTFRKDDYIMVQQFSGMPSLENDYYVTKQYELIVTEAGCGSLDDGEIRLDWVKFRAFTTSMEGKGAADLIKKGDTFVRVDNLMNQGRKGIVEVMTVGENTPYIDVIHGLKTDPDNALKGRMGNLAGIYHHLFGWLKGFGEYLINLYAVGDFRLRNTGENLDAKIEALRGLLATSYSQTVYDITEDDNYLQNANFVDLDEDGGFRAWTVESEDVQFYTVNGLPLYENTSLMSKVAQKVALEEMDGKSALHLVNGKVTQKNKDVRKPGTHKVYVEPDESATEEYTEEKDTLYLSLRVKVMKSGKLTVGFPDSESVEKSLPKVEVNLDKSGEWETYLWSGTWDGRGDFVLSFSGECYLSLLSLTDEPLTDFKTSYNTQIVQTAKNITLLASRVSGNETNIAQLQITADGLLSTVKTLKDGIETNSSMIEQLSTSITAAVQRISDNETAISQLKITADGIEASVTKLRSDMEKGDQELSSRITQTAEDITAAVKRISDNESSIAQLKITADEISATVESNYTDLDGRVKSNKSAITQTATDIRAELSQEVTNLDGEIDTAKSALEASINGIAARVESVENMTTLHTTQIGGIGDDIEGLRGDFTQMGIDIQGLEFDVVSVTERVGQLEVSDTSILARVSSVETVTATHTTQISGLEGDVDDLESDLGTTKTSLTRVTERVGSLEVTSESITSRVSSVETVTATHTTQIGNLSDDVDDLESGLSTANSNISTVTSRVSSLETTSSNISATVSSVQQTVNTLTGEVSTVKSSVGSLEVRADVIEMQVVEVNEGHYQLLDDTDFLKVQQRDSDGNLMWNQTNGQAIMVEVLDAWDIKNGSVSTSEKRTSFNSYYGNNSGSGSMDLIRQQLWIPGENNPERIVRNRWYTLSFYVKGSGRMRTFVYPGCVDTSEKCFVDGVEQSPNGDGRVDWYLSGSWERHTYTFKTLDSSTFYNTAKTYYDIQYLLFRLMSGSYVYLSEPRLEMGMEAHLYQEDVSGLKRTGIDIESGKITLDAETAEATGNFIVKRLLTDGSDTGVHVEIYDGIMEVFGPAGVANWRFGVGDDGEAILSYYDNTGEKRYDLGPNGLTAINNTQERFVQDKTSCQIVTISSSSDVENVIQNLLSSTTNLRKLFTLTTSVTTYYRYSARKTVVDGSYTYHGSDTLSSVQYASDSTAAKNADQKLFTAIGNVNTVSRVNAIVMVDGTGNDGINTRLTSCPDGSYEQYAEYYADKVVWGGSKPVYCANIRVIQNGVVKKSINVWSNNIY